MRAALLGIAGGLLFLGAAAPAVAQAVLDTAPHAVDAPHVAVGTDGTVAVACAAGDDILCAVSRDGGARFAAPVRVGAQGRLEHGLLRGPRVAVLADALVVTAVCGAQLGGRDGDLLAWRSADRGATWQGPAAVTDVPAAAREGLHALAGSSDGRLLAVWLDLRGGRTELWGSASADGGAGWTANACLYRAPGGSVCECCPPAVVFAPDASHARVLFRNLLDGNRDIHAVRVRLAPPAGAAGSPGDAAGAVPAAFEAGPAEPLGLGHWALEACPMAGPGLALTQDGSALSVWRRGGELYTAQPGAAEVRLAAGREAHAAAGPDGAYILFTDPEGHVRSVLVASPARAAPAESAPSSPAAPAADASPPGAAAAPETRDWGRGFNLGLAGAPDGLGPVVAVWETDAAGAANLRVAVLAARAEPRDP